VDLDRREVAALAPILLCCLLLGICPQPVINVAKQDLDIVAAIVKKREDAALARAGQQPPQQVAEKRRS
jgi:NADH:ubiquinone oxidoreductase subunit 4 (subunit M)